MFVVYIEKIKELRTERLLLSLDTRSTSLYQNFGMKIPKATETC
jgi:hypothetical protein